MALVRSDPFRVTGPSQSPFCGTQNGCGRYGQHAV